MALGLIIGIARAYRRKRTSPLDILSSNVHLVTTIRARIASLRFPHSQRWICYYAREITQLCGPRFD
ncbi:hypothetical protein K2173_007979 [Erythroxylum novogranatense]|uniref:Uncharacterized protein n=1 Tax=Erythroxylum novogranatense TaxID=1862640 RepID=A0AAV8T8J4_9ROSI|nr:hypothetical protein K2173_007979 [Erythroxylum novogranatense]